MRTGNRFVHQVVSLPVAKIMRDLGWKNEGFYYWSYEEERAIKLNIIFASGPPEASDSDYCIAATTPEIAAAIPVGFGVKRTKTDTYIAINPTGIELMQTVSSSLANAYGKLWILLEQEKQRDKQSSNSRIQREATL